MAWQVYAEALHARLKYQSAAEHFTAAAEYINPKENLESASTSRFMENKEKIDSAATKKKSKQHANDLSALLSRGSIATSALIDAAVQDDETASQSSQGVAAEEEDEAVQELYTQSNGKEDASDSAAEAEIANAHVSNAPADAPVHQEAKAEGSKAKQTTAAGGEGSCNACPAAAALADGCTSLRDADDVQSNANESAASQLEQEHSKFPPALKALEGVVVLLSGLSKECYNGATAKVVGYNETNGRFVMLLVDTEHANRKIQVKPSNITPKPRANTVSIPGNFQDLAFDPENDILLTHIVAPGPNGDLKGFQEQVQEAVNASSKLAYDLNNIVSKDKIGSGADFSESLSETLKANNLDPGRVGQLFDKLQGMLGDKADDMGTDDLGTDNRLEIEEILEHEPLTLDSPNGSAGEKIDEVADEDDALTTHVDRQSVNRAISSEVPSTISQFDVGDHIRLHGLGKAYYNGLEGSVIEVKRQAGRIGVRISSTKTAGELDETAKVEVFGKELSVKPENLEKLMPRVITPNYKPDAAEQLVQSNIIKGVEPAPLSADTAQKTPRIKTPFGYLEAVVGPSGAAALAASGGGGMNGDVTLQDLDGSLRIDDIARGNSNAVADTEPSFEDLLQSFKDEDEARKNKKSGSKGALEEGAPVATSPDGPAKRKKKKKKKKKSAAASAAADGGSSMLADGQNDKAVPVASTAATSPKTGTLTGIRQREIRAKRETMDAKEDDHSLTLQDVADYEVFVQGMIDAMEGEKQQLQRKYRMAEAKLKHTRDSRRIRVLGEEIDNLKRREQRFNGDVAYVNEEVERFHNSPAFKVGSQHSSLAERCSCAACTCRHTDTSSLAIQCFVFSDVNALLCPLRTCDRGANSSGGALYLCPAAADGAVSRAGQFC